MHILSGYGIYKYHIITLFVCSKNPIYKDQEVKNMLNYSADGVTVAIIQDTRKANMAGTYPIKIRVTYQRVRRYYSTGKTLTPEEWDKLPTAKSHLYAELRRDVTTSFELVKKSVQSLTERGDFTFNNLDARWGAPYTGH